MWFIVVLMKVVLLKVMKICVFCGSVLLMCLVFLWVLCVMFSVLVVEVLMMFRLMLGLLLLW